MDFTQSPSGPLDDIKNFVRVIPCSYKSAKHTNITGIDKIQLKCDCNNGSTVNGVREPFLHSFALDQPPGHKRYNPPGIKFFRKINKSVLSHIAFFLKDDEYKPGNFSNKTISFSCHFINI